MKYQAIIVDLDRTLLRTDKTISEYTLQILRTCQQIGIRLFAATARPERAITMYQKILDFDAVTTLNGARTITKDAVYENFISRPSAESVLNQLPKQLFIQCQRSYVVNILYVRHVAKGVLTMSDGKSIQLGRSFQAELVKRLRQFYIEGCAD